MESWPATAAELAAAQERIAASPADTWTPPPGPVAIAGCFACGPRPHAGAGSAGDPLWAAAVAMRGRRVAGFTVVAGTAGGPYRPGLLALRAGPVLEAAVRALPKRPEAVLVNATGADHPRRCGLAAHLGAVLGLPTVGVTHRPLLASGPWPPDEPGAIAPLRIGSDVVGYWLRSRAGRRPIAVTAGYRTDAEGAVALVQAALRRARTPEPLRRARTAARAARAEARGLAQV